MVLQEGMRGNSRIDLEAETAVRPFSAPCTIATAGKVGSSAGWRDGPDRQG